jgi:hypothetical protein
VIKGNKVEVYNEKGELVQEREATLEDVYELLREYIDKKMVELTTQYRLEITIDPKTFTGVARIKEITG